MSEVIQISKLIDKYLPANGVGTEREQIRIEMHNDIAMLVKNLTIPRVIDTVCHSCKSDIAEEFIPKCYCPECGVEWQTGL